MSQEHREAEARTRFRMLWQAISPVTIIQTGYAFRQAMYLTEENSPEIKEFADEYRECQEIADSRARVLSLINERENLALAWLSASQKMRNCTQETNTRLFPVEKLDAPILEPVTPVITEAPQESTPEAEEDTGAGENPPPPNGTEN